MTASDALRDVYFVGTPKPPANSSSQTSSACGIASESSVKPTALPPVIEEFLFDRPNITLVELRNEILAEGYIIIVLD